MAESVVKFRKQDIVPQLIAYGEDEAAEKLKSLDEKAVHRIGVLAFKHYLVPKTILNKAICLGVIEYLEGKSRELKRKRRIYSKVAK
jgi:hypothetical protein